MSAAVQATLPLYREALTYWDEFTMQCQRHINDVNAVLADHQVPHSDIVELQPGPQSLAMIRSALPSTEINLHLDFEHWGPVISGSVRGEQADDLHFYPEEFEFVVGTDQDESIVAITHEGKSLNPHEFAKFVLQNFRRSYPGITLPCPEAPLG